MPRHIIICYETIYYKEINEGAIGLFYHLLLMSTWIYYFFMSASEYGTSIYAFW